MNLTQVKSLKYFHVGEKRTDGQLIDWNVADFTLFQVLNSIREALGSPLRIIRESHPERPWPAADWIMNEPCERVAHVVGAYRVGFGIYAGTSGPSYHVDVRDFGEGTPSSRWMAVRPKNRAAFGRYEDLVSGQTDEWVYYKWTHPLSWECFRDVQILAGQNFNRYQNHVPMRDR